MTDSKAMFGRTVIYTDFDNVDSSNVLQVLSESLPTHHVNSRDIDYLYKYYRGNQPVLHRIKDVRPEINNKVVVNRANEIVDFKTGYLVGEPVQYVNRTGADGVSDAINAINEFMFAEDKASRDRELVDWMHICGTSYRMVFPDAVDNEDESPFEIYTLDPRFTFVVYHSGLGNKPLVAFKYIVKRDGTIVYTAYTATEYFDIIGEDIVAAGNHYLGNVPVVEYPANTSRLGAFEVVLPLLDAINEVASNRIDGVEQFIQSLLVLKGVDIDSDDFANLKTLGGIKVPSEGDVSYLVQELSQSSTQTLVDDLYQTVLTICSMPSQSNGLTSDSSNNGAVLLRNGWQSAEARAKDSELSFKKSEKVFLRMALNIANTVRGLNVKLSDIEVRFTRRNYEDVQTKATVLTTLLACDKVHPRLAFDRCNLFVDPELAYNMSEEYREEQEQKFAENIMLQTQNAGDNSGEDENGEEAPAVKKGDEEDEE